MLIIREKQMKVLNQEFFERQMIEHFQEYAPALFRLRGVSCFREVIREGRSRAESYGFTICGSIQLFIELMVSLGYGFDSDPQYPWADSILKRIEVSNQMDRAQQLYDESIEFMDKTMGSENEKAILAMRTLNGKNNLLQKMSFENLKTQILYELREIYSVKVAYVGEDQLFKLIDEGVSCARSYGMKSAQACGLITALFFAFGHNVDQDPLYPWIKDTLTNPKFPNENDRLIRLQKKSYIYMDAVLQHLEK